MEQLAEQLEQVDTAAGGDTDEPSEADMEQLAEQLNEVDTAAGDLSDLADALNVTDDTDLENQAEALNDIETAAGGDEIIVPTELGDAGEADPDNQEEQGALGDDPDQTPTPTPRTPETVAPTIEAQGSIVSTTDVTDAEDGGADHRIDLNISASLNDTDGGSETLSNVTISAIPAGSALFDSANNELSVNFDATTGLGEINLAAGQLAGLQIDPPENSSVDFELKISATSTENNGSSATTNATLKVTVDALADKPNLDVGTSTDQDDAAEVSGAENSAITLDITSSLVDTDGSETLSVEISGIPTGATLSLQDGSSVTVTNGTATISDIVNSDGTTTTVAQQLSGLNITPATDDDTDFSLTVSATSTDTDPDTSVTSTATATGTIDVNVSDQIADAPTLTVADANAVEDTPINLSVASSLTDTDGSETLSVEVSGIPDGATLSLTDGTVISVTDGVASVDPAQLANLQIQL